MIHTYNRNEEHKEIRFTDDVNLILNKEKLAIELAKSNGRLAELKKDYEKELSINNELIAKRQEIYKQERIKELENSRDGKLPNMREQIEIYFSQGKCYEEISLLTRAKHEYIYKVICNYKKRSGISKKKHENSDKVELIIGCRKANMSIKQIVEVTKVSRQYVYRVLKEHNVPYPHKKK